MTAVSSAGSDASRQAALRRAAGDADAADVVLEAPVRPGFVGVLRLVVFFGATLAYLIRVVIQLRLAGVSREKIFALRQTWSRVILRLVGVEIHLQGDPPDPSAALILPNHRSYIDAAIVLREVMATIVAKIQVASWPVIGAGCKASDVVFVDRGDRDSRRATREQIKVLAARQVPVIVFPEGTTFEGPGMLPMRPGTFIIAADGSFTVVPMAIEYEHVSDAWVGEATFVGHFLECFSKHRTRVAIRFGPPMTDTEWEPLKERVEGWIRENLAEMRAGWDAHR